MKKNARMLLLAALVVLSFTTLGVQAKGRTITYNCTNATGVGPGASPIKDFDYSYKEWDYRSTWTASNGVVLKVVPYYAPSSDEIVHYELVIDGQGIDLMEGSPYMQACEELYQFNGTYQPGTNVHVPESFWVPVTSSKHIFFEFWNDPAFQRFSNKFHEISAKRFTGKSNALSGEYDLVGRPWYIKHWRDTALGYGAFQFMASRPYSGGSDENTWEPMYHLSTYGDDCMQINLYFLPTAFEWDAIHNILRLMTPDAEAVYKMIYSDYYLRDQGINEYDTWYPVGSNTEIMRPDPYYYNPNWNEWLDDNDFRGVCYLIR